MSTKVDGAVQHSGLASRLGVALLSSAPPAASDSARLTSRVALDELSLASDRSQIINSSTSLMSDSKGTEEEKTTWGKSSSQFNNKQYSEYFDPCQDAANRSLKCMRRNGGDRAMCMDYFDAYKACKKSWMDEMKEQKRKEAKSWFS